ncbi:m-AAA protease-interacting protein 1, mitochondrial [Merluccius polli]|uniref:M-AAA protease-interacting protein 1, mitochondrial n=1 Tax=Merluccius polli TaxID=89951 RepID=A0AA47N8F0_MERPO|nr:m-AAA protease-interacting protein 1, mitochondrial [Merluccius polli]
MALPLLRGVHCCRLPSLLHITHRVTAVTRPSKPHLSPAGALLPARCYSSEGPRMNQKVMVLGIPNPLIWVRTRLYYFLIRAYFDKEFRIEEFTEGAKQAFSHVSRLLSQCQFNALDGLVAQDLVGKLEEKCNLLPASHKQALSASTEDILYTTPSDVGIYYDDNGRKFVSILMRFWYLTSARLPEEAMEGSRIFKMALGTEGQSQAKRLLTANYEFQREFTKGVAPDWTITRIEHSKLLD